MAIELISYGGWKRALRLADADVEAVVTLDVGPRVVRFAFAGQPSLLHEVPEQLGGSGEPTWRVRGGHRLWAAPERRDVTYAPDNDPIEHAVEGGWAHVTQRPDAAGLRKEMWLRLCPGARLEVRHRLSNAGARPRELAPWAVTVMGPGGTALVPLPEKRPHPGSPETARADDEYWPDQALVMWPFLDLSDPRLRLGRRFLRVRQGAGEPLKLGLAPHRGLVAYLRDGQLFAKWIPLEPGSPFPDRGCNFELYTDRNIVELESLGPLRALAPGESVELTEAWALRRGVPAPAADDDALAAQLAELALTP